MPNCIQDPSHDCFGLAEAEILKQHIENVEKQMKQDRKERKREAKSNKKDHKEFYRRMESSERNQAITQNQLAQILCDTQEIKGTQTSQSQSISELKEKPAKNWEKLVWQVITLVVAAVGGIVLGKIGLTG